MNETYINPYINCSTELQEYHQRSIYDSNCIEFWAPITDRIIPNVIPFRYWISTYGRMWNTKVNRIMSYSTHRKGYYQLGITCVDGKRITRKVHRLVMMTFCYVPGCKNLEVNHKDSNRKNNNILNLEWATPSENTIHGIMHGNKKVFGNSEAKVILTDKDVEEIYSLHESGYGREKIYQMFLQKYPNLNRTMINNICTGVARKAYLKKTNRKVMK